MPPIATEMKPKLVKNPPVSNSSEVIGATDDAADAAQERRHDEAQQCHARHVDAHEPCRRAVFGASAQRQCPLLCVTRSHTARR